MTLLHGQSHVSPQRGLPVDDKGNSSTIVSVTGETVQLYYSNAGVWTVDAGQVAGVVVVAQLKYNNVKNVVGNLEGTPYDTSLSFTSTALTTEVRVDWSTIESMDDKSFANRIAAITDGLANGEYVVDYSNGTLYAVKASNTTTLTATAYKVQSGVSSGGTAVVAEVEGVAAEDAAASGNPLLSGGRYDTTDRTLDNGDVGAIAVDVAGKQKVVGSAAEDAAVTGNPVLVGGRYDATDRALDDGDVGADALDVAGNKRVVGNVAHDAADTGNPLKIGARARSSDIAAVAVNDRVDLVADLYGKLLTAAHTFATTSDRKEEVDPLNQQYLNQSLVDTTNVSAATHYYPSATGGVMDSYADQSLTGKFIDADGTLTLTLEVMNDEDTAGDWVQAYFYDDKNNVTTNSLTVTNGTLTFAISANVNNFRRYRWVVVASGATNTVILKERKKAL